MVNGEAVPDPDGLVDRLRRAAPGLTGVVLSVNRDRTNVVLGRRQITLWGRDWLEDITQKNVNGKQLIKSNHCGISKGTGM